MHCVLRTPQAHVLRFDKGDEILEELSAYCAREKIHAAHFSAIGAARQIVIAWYDVDSKSYIDSSVNGKLEIVGLQGTVARMEEEIIVHAHGSFSDERMHVQGGHVKKCVVGATCELVLTLLEGTLPRAHSKEIGLNLLV